MNLPNAEFAQTALDPVDVTQLYLHVALFLPGRGGAK